MKNWIKSKLFEWMFKYVAIQQFNVSIDDKYATATIVVQSFKKDMLWLYDGHIKNSPSDGCD